MTHLSFRRFLAVSVVSVLTFAPVAASAQDGDPYGATSTTQATVEFEAQCNLDLTEGEVGSSVVATVPDVPLGRTVVVLFGGTEVGRATAGETSGASATGAVVFGGRQLAGAADVQTVNIAFTVPEVDDGSYLVTAVGDDFTVECGPEVEGLFLVQGGGTAGTDGGGSLPFTGANIGLLVLVAIALIVGGRVLMGRRRDDDAEADSSYPTA